MKLILLFETLNFKLALTHFNTFASIRSERMIAIAYDYVMDRMRLKGWTQNMDVGVDLEYVPTSNCAAVMTMDRRRRQTCRPIRRNRSDRIDRIDLIAVECDAGAR